MNKKIQRKAVILIILCIIVWIGYKNIYTNDDLPVIVTEEETNVANENLSERYALLLLGEETITIKKEENFEDPGIWIFDGNGKRRMDLEGELAINEDVNTEKEGIYYVKYSFRDMTVSRKIIVE